MAAKRCGFQNNEAEQTFLNGVHLILCLQTAGVRETELNGVHLILCLQTAGVRETE